MTEKIDLRKYYNGKPKFSWAEEMVEYEYVQPKHLIRPIIPPATWGVLYGHPEAGKTQLALSMAIAIASGDYFLGRFKCHRGKVGIIQIDTESPIMTERLQAIQKKYDLGEQTIGIAHYDTPIDIFEMMKRWKTEPEIFDWLQPMIDNKFDFVIIDSFNKVHNEKEDNNLTPKKVYGAFRNLLGSGPTIMFIHHSRKDPNDSDYRHENDEHDARGSGALKADGNFMFKLTKKKNSEIRTLHFLKAKGCPPQYKVPINITFDPETILFQPEDPAFSRAFPLVELGVDRSEVVKILVTEKICGKDKAYKTFKECEEVIELNQ